MGNFPDGVFFEKVLGAAWRGGVPARICGAAIDSRKISPGEIFVALKTEKRDGHDFLEAARARGAAGALVSRFVPASPLPPLWPGTEEPARTNGHSADAHEESGARSAPAPERFPTRASSSHTASVPSGRIRDGRPLSPGQPACHSRNPWKTSGTQAHSRPGTPPSPPRSNGKNSRASAL